MLLKPKMDWIQPNLQRIKTKTVKITNIYKYSNIWKVIFSYHWTLLWIRLKKSGKF